MKNRKYLIAIILLISVLLLIGCQNNQKTNTTNYDSAGNPIPESELNTDAFEAKVNFDGDHFVLRIFTNYVEKPISITYNSEDFLFDDQTPFLSENSSFTSDGSQKTYTINLKSNELYNFNFIKLREANLVIGETLTIE